jgi:ribosomal protein L37E
LTRGRRRGHASGELKPNTAVVNRNSGGTVVPIGTSLGSLGEHERLHAYCRRCQRYRSLDVLALLDRHGDLHLRTVQRRLRCLRCGAREAELIRATALPW